MRSTHLGGQIENNQIQTHLCQNAATIGKPHHTSTAMQRRGQHVSAAGCAEGGGGGRFSVDAFYGQADRVGAASLRFLRSSPAQVSKFHCGGGFTRNTQFSKIKKKIEGVTAKKLLSVSKTQRRCAACADLHIFFMRTPKIFHFF